MDLIVIALVFTLAMKGLLNGYIRELINLFATIGAIFVASKLATSLSKWVEAKHLFNIDNPAMINMISFFALLILVWLIITLIGRVALRLEREPLKPIDRVLGLLVAGVKYFFIISIIIFALFQTKLIKERFASQSKQSILYPYMKKSAEAIIGDSIGVINP